MDAIYFWIRLFFNHEATFAYYFVRLLVCSYVPNNILCGARLTRRSEHFAYPSLLEIEILNNNRN